MRTALLTLFGFLSFTVVCPITMGAMPMDMGNMPEMSHMMQSDDEDKGEMPCEQCKKDKEEIVASFSSQTEFIVAASVPVTLFAFWELAEPTNNAIQRMPLLANGPPIPTETLVGTVILRT